MNKKFVALGAIGLIVSATPALAHHSFAMFDNTKEVELKDVTVKDWQWTSPHTWLFVVSPDGTKWSIEGGNPGALRREGFSKGSMSPGDKITVYIAPLRSGAKGGSINAVVTKDGKMLGQRTKH